jgi:hypothetical protein
MPDRTILKAIRLSGQRVTECVVPAHTRTLCVRVVAGVPTVFTEEPRIDPPARLIQVAFTLLRTGDTVPDGPHTFHLDTVVLESGEVLHVYETTSAAPARPAHGR